MSLHVPFSRRRFVQGAAAVAALSSSSVRSFAANSRINIGVVGWGMMGPANTKSFLTYDDCRVVAACDIHKKHLDAAVNTVNSNYGTQDCKPYHDYREMFQRDDIDAVMLAIPDQWHAIVATAAANRKKDIYGEKPLARTIAEQQAIVRAVQQNKVIWQTGSWQRSISTPQFHKSAEIVRNGLIGNVTHVEVGLPGGHTDFPHTVPAQMKRLRRAYRRTRTSSASDAVADEVARADEQAPVELEPAFAGPDPGQSEPDESEPRSRWWPDRVRRA